MHKIRNGCVNASELTTLPSSRFIRCLVAHVKIDVNAILSVSKSLSSERA